MRLSEAVAVFSFAAVFTAGSCHSAELRGQHLFRRDGATIDSVLTEVQRALSSAQARLNTTPFPKLESVELTLQTKRDFTRETGFSFLVFSFGDKWQSSQSHELTLTLKPPSPAEATVSISSSEDLTTFLVDAIVAASEGTTQAASRAPALELTTLKTTISFVVAGTTSTGLAVDLVPVSPEVKGNLSSTATHKLAITFSP